MSILEVRDLSAGYGSRQVLSNISFRLEASETVGLLGENGSGKSTLLKAVSGLLSGTGEVRIGGKELRDLSVRDLARRVSYVPQKSGISADVSALEVVLWGFNPELGVLGKPGRQERQKAMEALKKVGLSDIAERSFLTLSEGQKQAVIFGRILAAERLLCLLDEPESALDFERRYELLKVLRGSIRERGAGALAALHDPQLALDLCDRLLILKDGELRAEIRPENETVSETEAKLRILYPSAALLERKAPDGTVHKILYREERS